MRCGESAALAGLKIHDIGTGGAIFAKGATVQRDACLVALLQHGKRDAAAAVCGFGSTDGLKDEIDRRARIDDVERGGQVGEHAGLYGGFVVEAEVVEHLHEARNGSRMIARGVDADCL